MTYTETGEEKVSEVNIATYTAWTEGMFYFEDVPLEEIMGALGRWYNVNIDFERRELYHIRLNFWANKNTHLDEALELLNKLEKVQVTIRTEPLRSNRFNYTNTTLMKKQQITLLEKKN